MKLLALLLLLATAFNATAASDRPNVLFIVCDDLNTQVGPSGYPHTKTPNLDQFASKAVTFQRAYCQYPVCGPSRASFLSGLYPESTGVIDNTADIRNERPNTHSLPQSFKENGYWTGATGKIFHNTKADHGDVAWDEMFWFQNDELPVVAAARKKFEAEHGSVDLPKNRRAWKELSKATAAPLFAQTPPGHGPSGLADEEHKDGKNRLKVIEWLEDKPYGDKPFFIACGFQKPHVAFLAPEKYFDLYPREELQYTPNRPDLWDSIPLSAQSKRYTAFGFELGVEKDALRREYMQAYHACISFMDAQLGMVLQALKDQGLWDDTIVVFTSDHGYHLGEHFMWGKVTLFDLGARVPLIVRAPGITQPGRKSQAIVELLDLYPTLTGLAGIPAPKDLQGRSLLANLKNPAAPGKSHAYTVVTRGPKLGRAIRNADFRYTEWPDGEEYYDLRNDPGELNNLAKNPEFKSQLKQARGILKARVVAAATARSKS